MLALTLGVAGRHFLSQRQRGGEIADNAGGCSRRAGRARVRECRSDAVSFHAAPRVSAALVSAFLGRQVQ